MIYRVFHHTYSSLLLLSFLLLTLSHCSSQNNREIESQARLRTGTLVTKYGQIVGEEPSEYLRHIQQRLTDAVKRASDRRLQFKIILLNTKKPMAFSAGAGFILISKGLVLALNTEAELAFVIAHEMAHEYLSHNETLFSGESSNNTPSRDNASEIEADRMALAILAAAGYDPRYALDSLQNLFKLSALNNAPREELNLRSSAIRQFIEESKWQPPGTIDRRDFHTFKQNI